MTPPLQLDGLGKTYSVGLFRKRKALDNLSLTVSEGEVLGILGPNGSGKSTTFKMILGLIRPTTGRVFICGFSPEQKQARSQIGYLPENPRFQRFLTGRQILRYYGRLLGFSGSTLMQLCDRQLELVRLSHASNEKVQGYSKGMVQRLAIAQALLGSPKILILDEPMSGLDPTGRIQLRRLISNVHQELPQTTILFSTHIVSDAEDLCTNVILLRDGHLIHQLKLDSLPPHSNLEQTLFPDSKENWGEIK